MLASRVGRLTRNRDCAIAAAALVTLAASTGLFMVWPRAGVVLALIVALVVVPAIWLVGRWTIHAVLGAFLYLTILRPLPLAQDTVVVDRALDVVWLAMAAAVVLYAYRRSSGHLRVWRGLYWLVAGGALMVVSLVVGAIAGQQVIARDLFEFYRAPFYVLVLLGATQVDWDRADLSKHLMKPLLAALAVSGAFAIVQMDIYTGKGAVTIAYYVRYAEWFPRETDFLAATSGTFGNPNWYGVALGVTLPVMWAASSALRRPGYFVPSAVAVAILIVLTGSRTALLAASAGAGVYALMWATRYLFRVRRSTALPMTTITLISWLAVILVFGLGVTFSGRHHATAMALGRGVVSEVSALADRVWPFGTEGIAVAETEASTRKSLVDELRDATVSGFENRSFDSKLDGSVALASEAVARSPWFGLGPSKSRDSLLGDNQYSLTFYRYGLVGIAVWAGFRVALVWQGLMLWWRRVDEAQAFGAALVTMAVVMVVAGVGGAFFDARQIAVVMLILAGVSMSVRPSESRAQVD